MLEVEEGQQCPSCGATASPEQDGDVLYQACDCGFEFGYHRVAAPEPSCQLGIPEGIRFKVSAAQPDGVLTLESGAERQSVFIGGTIRRRPPELLIGVRRYLTRQKKGFQPGEEVKVMEVLGIGAKGKPVKFEVTPEGLRTSHWSDEAGWTPGYHPSLSASDKRALAYMLLISAEGVAA
jgi:hypothetical protein